MDRQAAWVRRTDEALGSLRRALGRIEAAAIGMVEGVSTRTDRVAEVARLADVGRRVLRRIRLDSEGLSAALSELEGEARGATGEAGDLRDAIGTVAETLAGVRASRTALTDEVAATARMAEEMAQSVRGVRLLAFSAAIEAARAGEPGGAFGVVAQRMQDLARDCEDRAVALRIQGDAVHKQIVDYGERARRIGADVETLPAGVERLRMSMQRTMEHCATIETTRGLLVARVERLDRALDEAHGTVVDLRQAGRAAQAVAGRLSSDFAAARALLDGCAGEGAEARADQGG